MQPFSASATHVLRFINQTRRSVFLTGKAGTGKTTLLREIIRTTHKDTVVVAPTGIAALNAGGVTLHSMFGLPLSSFVPDNTAPLFSDRFKVETRHSLRRHFRMSAQKRAVLSNLELLVIDEVSMLRADLLDAVDFTLQYIRKNTRPFGGVQVLYIGDLQQLPPVVKDEEWNVLKKYYAGKFFFHAHAVAHDPPLYIELTQIYRQSDEVFIDILNNLRNNRITPGDMQRLNRHVREDFDSKAHPGYITLTTHNAKADQINERSLRELEGLEIAYRAEITGDFPDKIFPIEETLSLKIGAQMMFVKNDLSPEKLYFNGKMGVVKSLSEEEIFVYFPEENRTIQVDRYEWQNIRYSVDENTKDITEDVQGTFVHYPIKLAWAITVHKSQGLTFDKAALDVSDVFMPGQAYVALSRLRSMDGLVLLSPIRMNGMRNDSGVMDFARNKTEDAALESIFESENRLYLRDFLMETFDWEALRARWTESLRTFEDGKGEQAKSAGWIHDQAIAIAGWGEPSRKFRLQLERLFAAPDTELFHIQSRLGAAISYFRPQMEAVLESVFWKLEEIARMKKAKQFFQEVEELESGLTKAVLRLFRARQMMECALSGMPLSKENRMSAEASGYRERLRDKVREAYKAANGTLVDEENLDRYSRDRKKEKKEKKKSTILQTYELWVEKRSIKEIAQLRSLTRQTIGTHIAKLIEARAIALTELLPDDKIRELAAIFDGYEDESLSPLKERHGDQFTWDELKWYKAALSAHPTV